MKDSELQFDRTCHVLYSRPCKKQIQSKIALHFPPDARERVWECVQRQYVAFLSDWRTDLGGKKNFHNGKGGTYDCIALMAYYVVCKDVTSLAEIEEMEGNLFLGAFRKLKFVNCNRPFFKELMYRAFLNAKKQCDKWGDYKCTSRLSRRTSRSTMNSPHARRRNSQKSTIFWRSCLRCATRITRVWSAFAPVSCAKRPAPTAVNAITRSAATATHPSGSTPSTATRPVIGEISDNIKRLPLEFSRAGVLIVKNLSKRSFRLSLPREMPAHMMSFKIFCTEESRQ